MLIFNLWITNKNIEACLIIPTFVYATTTQSNEGILRLNLKKNMFTIEMFLALMLPLCDSLHAQQLYHKKASIQQKWPTSWPCLNSHEITEFNKLYG